MAWQAASAPTGTRTTPSAKSTAAPTRGEATPLTLKCEADVLAIDAIRHGSSLDCAQIVKSCRYVGKEICFAYNEDTLTIVDVSDKAKPYNVSRVGYAGFAYTHQVRQCV